MSPLPCARTHSGALRYARCCVRTNGLVAVPPSAAARGRQREWDARPHPRCVAAMQPTRSRHCVGSAPPGHARKAGHAGSRRHRRHRENLAAGEAPSQLLPPLADGGGRTRPHRPHVRAPASPRLAHDRCRGNVSRAARTLPVPLHARGGHFRPAAARRGSLPLRGGGSAAGGRGRSPSPSPRHGASVSGACSVPHSARRGRRARAPAAGGASACAAPRATLTGS